MRLSSEEKELLQKLPLRSLHFFKKIANDIEFKSFTEVSNHLIDLEKNQFFKEGIEHEPVKLAIDHAFSRGGIAMIVKYLHLIMAAQHEISRREELRKNAE
jgi:selenocysteine-specific translation elongation factor